MNKWIIISLALLASGAKANEIQQLKKQSNTHEVANEKFCTLQLEMQKLWTEHVEWTREFIILSVAGLKDDAAVTAQRLLKNQDDMGNAIVPFYGKEAGNQLAKLLREHITIAANIVNAALAKDNQKVKILNAQWQANASDIARFLSSINPYFNQKALTAMLYEHLKLTTRELELRIAGNWRADIANFDVIFTQALTMGQELSDGIAKQFPTTFFKP